jgi:hypothetical protein
MRLTMSLALDGGCHLPVECDALPAWASMDFPYPVVSLAVPIAHDRRQP